jgi:glycosyltransferase involved in cell wall biosynthesis
VRIAYVCYWNLAAGDGVAKKIRTHVDTWRAAGHEVELFDLAPCPLHRRWAPTERVVREALAWQPELAYVRYDLFLPPIRRLLQRVPSVVEANSYDRSELRLRSMRASLYGELSRKIVLGGATGIVCVSRELGGLLASFGKPIEIVGNSVDLERLPATPPPDNAQPRLVYSGSPAQSWQGLDKLAQLARAQPEWRFDVVGPGARELGDAPPNVTIHGFLGRDDSAPLYSGADVAVGQLALHRRGVNENSPLKVREYLAYGLPVISGHRDPDFPAPEPWFLLRLPNNEENVKRNVGRIRAFVAGVRGRRVAHAEIAHLDVRVKEAARLRFMERMLTESRTHPG